MSCVWVCDELCWSGLGVGSKREETFERVVWVHLGSGFRCWFAEIGFGRELGAGFLRVVWVYWCWVWSVDEGVGLLVLGLVLVWVRGSGW